jgi:succinoglycan biosynthesis protein ExoM
MIQKTNPSLDLTRAKSSPNPHISVCVCTCERTELLKCLLDRLVSQETEGLFTYSVVVGDNDSSQSARQVVDQFSANAHLAITYCVEPERNIALMRNRVIENATGELIAFIDDDEFPADKWLCNLFKAYLLYEVDGILGPVIPHFDFAPPRWAQKGRFFERRRYPTGYRINWTEAATGNVLFRKSILEQVNPPFLPQFDSGGEDVDFFRRLMEKGFSFAWCDEAVAYEVVPRSRCKRAYLLKRALQRGTNFPKQQGHRLKNMIKSLIAVPFYSLALPILAIFGEPVFLRYLIKLCDHSSRILAFLGVKLIKQRV